MVYWTNFLSFSVVLNWIWIVTLQKQSCFCLLSSDQTRFGLHFSLIKACFGSKWVTKHESGEFGYTKEKLYCFDLLVTIWTNLTRSHNIIWGRYVIICCRVPTNQRRLIEAIQIPSFTETQLSIGAQILWV